MVKCGTRGLRVLIRPLVKEADSPSSRGREVWTPRRQALPPDDGHMQLSIMVFCKGFYLGRSNGSGSMYHAMLFLL